MDALILYENQNRFFIPLPLVIYETINHASPDSICGISNLYSYNCPHSRGKGLRYKLKEERIIYNRGNGKGNSESMKIMWRNLRRGYKKFEHNLEKLVRDGIITTLNLELSLNNKLIMCVLWSSTSQHTLINGSFMICLAIQIK